MPRSNGVYSEPAGTKGTPNTTIQSAPYNSFVDDLVQDANSARPVTAGGTGATNATAARVALGADNADNLTKGTVADARLPGTQAGKTFTTTTTFKAPSIGGVRAVVGEAAYTGFYEFLRADSVRSGYIGYANDAAKLIQIVAENGYRFNFEGTPPTISGSAIWNAGNDGDGSGLDADLLDGQQGSYYTNLANSFGILAVGKGGTGATTAAQARSNLGTNNADNLTTGNVSASVMSGLYNISITGDAATVGGFTPIQQGGGASQGPNKIRIGYSAANVLRLQVDATDFGSNWPISISGTATNASFLGGVSSELYAQYTRSTNTGETSFPVGQILSVAAPGGYTPRNQAAAVFLGADTTTFTTTNTGTQLAGTWRCRGASGGGYQSMQRTI